MSVSIELDLAYEFAVKAKFKEVFEVLSDVPLSASHFPKLERLVDLGGNAYRWEMARVGPAEINLQTVYASKYVANRKKGAVVWTPMPDVGNAQVGGSWKITDRKTSTHCVLEIEGSVTVPVPALMQPFVAAVVSAEFERVVEAYIDNLIKRFGGEVQED